MKRTAKIQACRLTRRDAIVICSLGHVQVAEFKCATLTDAETIAHTFESLGAQAAAMVYATIYAVQLESNPSDATEA